MPHIASPLQCSAEEKDPLEAQNGLEQLSYIGYLVNDLKIQEISEAHVRGLQAIAIRGIYPCVGEYRTAFHNVQIKGSNHVLPSAYQVPQLVRGAVDWINESRGTRSGLERASYALWRLNWIHPFAGGNGRTSRAIAYLILCVDMEAMLPGVPTVPGLIYDRREEYIHALQAADRGELATGSPDLSAMTQFLKEVVTRQLASAIDRLDGSPRKNQPDA